MTEKKPSIRKQSLARSFTASLAGLRAGGALALDGVRQKITGEEGDSDFSRREARLFVEKLGRLKGSYVKIGQMLAMFGEHFLPPVLTEALHELEDKTQPVPWSELEPTVAAALGDAYREIDVEPEAVAAASLAQVHRATIKSTGDTICLKIQYPDLPRIIDSDFDGVVRMLKAARWLKVGRDLDEWLETMRAQLHQEADYQREVTITESMKALLNQSHEAGDRSSTTTASIRVPTIYRQYCRPTIIAMEFFTGNSVKEASIKDLPLASRNALGLAMLTLFFREVFDWGLMQTDPNFGNYLVSLGSKQEPGLALCLIDFGSVLELEPTQRSELKRVIVGGLANDDGEIEAGLRGLGWLKADASAEAVDLFVRFCRYLLEPLRPAEQLPVERLNAQGDYRWHESELIQRVGKRGAKNAASQHFQMPSSDFSLFARKLTGVFTFIAYLRAEFNAYPELARFLESESTPERRT